MGLKLLYITNGINGSGGLERVLSVKASYFADHMNYDVTILSLNNGNDHPFYEFSSKIKFQSINVGGNPLQYITSYKKGIQHTIDEVKPDIISVCDDGLKAFFLPSIIKTKAKWIYERHASVELNKQSGFIGKLQATIMQYLVKSFDNFVVLTPSNLKEWKGNNIIAIPNPLSFLSNKENALMSKKIIAVGSHSYNKGYDNLIDIWSELENLYPDWSLHIYGKFDYEQTFIKQAELLNLKKCYFHQPYNPIQEKFEEASIMVLPSRSEGFGMVLIEAMACGVPCVSFDCPSGPRDIITDEIDGLLIESQNILKFQQAIEKLINDRKLRLQLGQKAKQNVTRYQLENIAKQWVNLFEN